MNYLNQYNLLIEKAQNRILNEYFETHHIIPRCVGGNNQQVNLIQLTPEEHYVAHQLLIKIYPEEPGLVYAAYMMGNTRSNNKSYGWLRRKFATTMSEQTMGQPKPKLRGRKRPDFSERLKGNSYGTANKGKKNLFLVERNKGNTYGKGNKGNTRPDLAARNKVQLTVTCPHCSKSGSNSNMKRWHFDNCKEKIKCIHL